MPTPSATRPFRASHVPLLAVFVLLAGCQTERTEESTVVELGIHRTRFVVPPDWLHADHGREQLFENRMARVTLADLGDASPEGFAETLREARSLFRHHQWEDARALLDGTDPRRFFPEETRWDEIEPHWKQVRHIRRREGVGENEIGAGGIPLSVVWDVEAAYHDLLVAVSSLSPLDLESLTRRALIGLRHDALRDIASERATSISGKPAIVIKTWDRLSHNGQRLHLFILSEGRLLCLKTGLGDFATLEPAFDAIRASLSLEPAQGSSGT
jgi:hypothetical protein